MISTRNGSSSDDDSSFFSGDEVNDSLEKLDINWHTDLPSEFDLLANHYKENPEKLGFLLTLYDYIHDKLSYVDYYSMSFFSSPNEKDWDSLNSKHKKRIVTLVNTFLDDNDQAYRLNIKFIAEMMILAKNNDDIYHLLMKSSEEHRVTLIKKLMQFCDKYEVNIESINYASLIPKLSHLIQNNLAEEIEYLFTERFTLIKKFNPTNRAKEATKINDFKLHLTLHWDDFCAHKQNIEDILIKYVIDGTIPEFKYFIPATEIDLDTIMKSGEFEELHPSVKRFVLGDQITIYLYPEDNLNYNQEKILKLCQELNNYCNEHSLREGQNTEVESLITPYINYRQEKVGGDYVYATIQDKEKIQELKLNQDTSDLYVYLTEMIQIGEKTQRYNK